MKTEKIFKLSPEDLKTALCNELFDNGYFKYHNAEKFLYAEGDAPYMLVAHLDTVHKELPSIICYSKDGNYMMSPQGIGGDDRCGVYIILKLIKQLPFKPYILFTMDEEIGGIGADKFVDYIEAAQNAPNLKYIIEYDRKGNNDCVFYSCVNDDFITFVEKFGFREAYGTFSDISTIAPALGVAAVNLSSGYHNPHTEHEYVSFKDMKRVIQLSKKMLTTECEKFEYVAKYSYYGSEWYKHRKNIKVCLVPAGTIYVYSYYNKGYILNDELELFVDKNGKYYKFDGAYGDIYPAYNTYPVTENYSAPYDEDDSWELPMSSYYDFD